MATTGRCTDPAHTAPRAGHDLIDPGKDFSMGEQTVSERLVRLETKLDMLIERSEVLQVDHETRLRKLERIDTDDHEIRLSKLEKMIWLAVGAALAGGGTAGTIASVLLGH